MGKSEVDFVCKKCGWKWSGSRWDMWRVIQHDKKHK